MTDDRNLHTNAAEHKSQAQNVIPQFSSPQINQRHIAGFDPGTIAVYRVMVRLRELGGSIRHMAQSFGVSKSTMHRRLSQISQLERLDPEFSKAIREEREEPPSQCGTDVEAMS